MKKKTIKILLTVLLILILLPFIILSLITRQKVSFENSSYVLNNSEIIIVNDFYDEANFRNIEGIISYRDYQTPFLLIQNGNLYKEKNGLEIEKPEVFFLLNGFKHGKEVIRILDYKQLLQKNFVLLSMDFYYPEKTDRFNVALNIGKIGLYVEKNMQLINALIKRLDYFDFIKHDEITFMGASLGAFVGLAPCAENSEKIKRIILAYAGSDLPLIVETKIPENLKKTGVSSMVKLFAEKKFSFADPANFINNFSEIPVLIINGTDDATIPHEAALKLQNSFEGKDLSVVTIDGKHIGIHRNDLIEETITHVTDWIKKER